MIRVRRKLVIDIRLREDVLCAESGRAVEIVQDVHDTPPVPVIRHTTTIVDVTSSVLQYLKI